MELAWHAQFANNDLCRSHGSLQVLHGWEASEDGGWCDLLYFVTDANCFECSETGAAVPGFACVGRVAQRSYLISLEKLDLCNP